MILALSAARAAAAPPDDRESRLREAVWGGRWLEGVRLYAELENGGAAPSPQASYLDGFALWKLRRLEDARPPLKKAAEAGFRAGPERLQPDELLAKIDAYLELRPPRADVPRLDGTFIAVYSDSPPGSPVLGALTRFPEIGRSIFGAPPPVRFFLFDRRPPFERFYGVFDESRGTRPQTPHSTGVVGMVIFCEGLAIYVAGLWSPEVAALPAGPTRSTNRIGLPPPTG